MIKNEWDIYSESIPITFKKRPTKIKFKNNVMIPYEKKEKNKEINNNKNIEVELIE